MKSHTFCFDCRLLFYVMLTVGYDVEQKPCAVFHKFRGQHGFEWMLWKVFSGLRWGIPQISPGKSRWQKRYQTIKIVN